MMTLFAIIFLVAVLIGGVVMAANGASSETFMVLVLLGAGALVLMMAVYYQKNPNYKDASGEAHTAGPGTLIFLYAMGVVLLAVALFVLLHGL